MATVGMLAGILTTGCWLPQLVRSWRTRSVGDISWAYLLALGLGVVLWVVYSAANGDLPLLLTNAATGTALVALVVMKARFAKAGSVQAGLVTAPFEVRGAPGEGGQ